jgi:SPW repeat-containing protein
LRFCPIPRSTELRSVIVHEHTDGRTVVGEVLLGIGASSVKEAVRWAAAARAVVVLVRGEDEDTTFEGIVEGVAVMMVDSAMSWSELAAVVYGLVLEGRETESGRGPTDLFTLADSLAEASGGAVTIEDRLSRVLACSRLQQHADPARVQTIMDRQAPEPLREFFGARGFALFLSPWAGGFVADNAAWTAWIAGALATALGVGGYLRGERLEFTTSVRDDAARQYRARFGRIA